jgi:NADH-quinone oxidoreductase subunit M
MPIELLRILLLCLLAIPLGGAGAAAVLGPGRTAAIRWISLGATVATFILACILAAGLAQRTAVRDGGDSESGIVQTATFQPEIVPGAAEHDPHTTQWDLVRVGPRRSAIQFYIGLDGLNVWLVLLTALLMVPSVLISWNSFQVRERTNEYYAWLLLLEAGMLGVFLAFDIVLFYVFFELTLVPLFFIIGIWGGPERRHAARKFFIYTLAGSLITMLGILGIVIACYYRSNDNQLTFSIPQLVSIVNQRLAIQDVTEREFWHTVQFWVFLALAAGFSVKVPLVPLHTWLPLAHVEAPTAGSVVLAGVLLKIGAYGFLRLCLPLAPDACLSVGVPLIGTLAVIGIIYGALCALVQNDFKKLVAYSSVSHLGMCMLGMFALNFTGLSGSLLQMINHGLSTGALFLLVGMLYERYHTRLIKDYGGMAARLHLLACFMVFICFTSAGLPGLNGFVGEALVFLGMFDFRPVLAVVGTTGIVLGAWYLLQLLYRVFFGPLKEPASAGHGLAHDLDHRELGALIPIALSCVLIGVYPQPFLDVSRPSLQVVADIAARARQRAEESQLNMAHRRAVRTQMVFGEQAGEFGR